jgi:hypothetical protein
MSSGDADVVNITTTGKLRNVGSALIKHLPPPFMRGMLMSIRTMSMCGASVQGATALKEVGTSPLSANARLNVDVNL